MYVDMLFGEIDPGHCLISSHAPPFGQASRHPLELGPCQIKYGGFFIVSAAPG
jgi:hypothetical protein